jgi:hypothetical protein
VDIDPLDKIGSDISPGGEPLPDGLAKLEEKKFIGDKRRAEEAKQAVHWAIIWFIRVAAIIVIIIFAVRMVFYVLPTSWRWLTDEQVKSMDDFLFHGIVGGIVGLYLRKSFQPKDEG